MYESIVVGIKFSEFNQHALTGKRCTRNKLSKHPVAGKRKLLRLLYTPQTLPHTQNDGGAPEQKPTNGRAAAAAGCPTSPPPESHQSGIHIKLTFRIFALYIQSEGANILCVSKWNVCQLWLRCVCVSVCLPLISESAVYKCWGYSLPENVLLLWIPPSVSYLQCRIEEEEDAKRFGTHFIGLCEKDKKRDRNHMTLYPSIV